MKEIGDLIAISQLYVKDKNFVIAGGGNTSYKNSDKIWVKASGHSLATIDTEGFAVLDRTRLKILSEKEYSQDFTKREEQVKNDLLNACITEGKRPSVETSIHNVIDYKYVVHLHPLMVNALMCSQNAYNALFSLFGDAIIYIPYTDPGYVLFKKVENEIYNFQIRFKHIPSVIWLQNHGIFVAADSVAEIKNKYKSIIDTIEKMMLVPNLIATESNEPDLNSDLYKTLTKGSEKLKCRRNSLIQYFSESQENFKDVSIPFTPDAIVYCKSNYIYIENDLKETLIQSVEQAILAFNEKYSYSAKVVLIKNIGLCAIADTEVQCEIILNVFEDAMKIASLSKAFGGPHPMTQEQINFIDNCEVENYRRSLVTKV